MKNVQIKSQKRIFRDMTEYARYVNGLCEEEFISEVYAGPFRIDNDFPRNTLVSTIKTLKYCGLFEQSFSEKTIGYIKKYKLLLEG
jgi:hypothetical protein